MEKLTPKSPDLTQKNIDKLAELFPNVVTETRDEDGARLAIDFDLLRQELSDHVVEGPQERYQLDWPGKRQALLSANAPIAKTLRPFRDESVDFDNTKNLFIEGDNLDALKLLQESYLGKVKLIYIDPPYNTGNDFVYEDDFAETTAGFTQTSGHVDNEGNRLKSNPESNGRFHSDWLSMVYPRLKLARSLLTEDGVVFISIGDHELHNLLEIAGEIFGYKNHVGTIVWKKKTNGNNVGHIPPVHDFIVVFAKDIMSNSIVGHPIDAEAVSSKYSNPDEDPRGPWTVGDLSANHEGPYFEITNPTTGECHLPPPGRYWVFNEAEVQKRISDGRIIFGKSGVAKPVQKKFLKNRLASRKKPETWWDAHGMNEDGSLEIAELLGPKVFSHPKPSELIRNIIEISTNPDSIILDFFAGSGSTAHAVMKQNALDGGTRQFILIQLDEPVDDESVAAKSGFSTISEICRRRMEQAGLALATGQQKEDIQHDRGFRTLKLGSTNFNEVTSLPDSLAQVNLLQEADNMKAERTTEDLLFECLIDWGLDLSLAISYEDVDRHKVVVVDGGAFISCFDEQINSGLVRNIAKREPLRAVFRDSSFESDADRINAEQIFKELSPATDVKVI